MDRVITGKMCLGQGRYKKTYIPQCMKNVGVYNKTNLVNNYLVFSSPDETGDVHFDMSVE